MLFKASTFAALLPGWRSCLLQELPAGQPSIAEAMLVNHAGYEPHSTLPIAMPIAFNDSSLVLPKGLTHVRQLASSIVSSQIFPIPSHCWQAILVNQQARRNARILWQQAALSIAESYIVKGVDPDFPTVRVFLRNMHLDQICSHWKDRGKRHSQPFGDLPSWHTQDEAVKKHLRSLHLNGLACHATCH